jgi:hypothetical protein
MFSDFRPAKSNDPPEDLIRVSVALRLPTRTTRISVKPGFGDATTGTGTIFDNELLSEPLRKNCPIKRA